MKNLKKSSFTLIELLMAIIIVGIAVTSIPMILAAISRGTEVTTKSDSIYNAYTTLALVESLDWDENNTKGDNFYKVLTADNGDSELKCERKGTKELDNESGADCDGNKTSHIGVDDGEDETNSSTFDDVDDFNGYEVDNLTKYNIKVGVYYVNDNADYSAKNIFFNDTYSKSSGTNIKVVEINVTKKNGDLIMVIRGESDNIGAVKIYSKNVN